MSTTTITIHVTQEDIEKGRPHSSCGCPVARAISRSIGKPCRIGYSDVSLVSDNKVFCQAPEPVRSWILVYDRLRFGVRSKEILQISFDLSVPSELLVSTETPPLQK